MRVCIRKIIACGQAERAVYRMVASCWKVRAHEDLLVGVALNESRRKVRARQLICSFGSAQLPSGDVAWRSGNPRRQVLWPQALQARFQPLTPHESFPPSARRNPK